MNSLNLENNLQISAFKHRALNLVLLIVTLLLFAICFVSSNYSENMQFILTMIVFSVIGIPHGSMDHVIYQQMKKNSDKAIAPEIAKKKEGNINWLDKTYLKKSFLGMLGYLIIWLLSPLLGFVLFIIVSAFHFGESQLYHYATSVKWRNHLIYLLWGINVLFTIMLLNIAETQEALVSIFPNFNKDHFVYMAFENYQSWLFFAFLFANLGGLLYLKMSKSIQFTDLFIELLILFTLFLIFYYLPLLLGFIFYFGIWHSIKAIQQIFLFQKKIGVRYSIKKFYSQTFVNSLVSIIGIAALLIADYNFKFLDDLILLFYIIISIITIPHFILFSALNLTPSKR